MSENAKLYMKLTGASSGEIKGESEADTFEGQIELNDWKWGLGRSSQAEDLCAIGSSIPPPPNSVEPSVFSFGKLMDRSTTAMLSAMRTGELMTAVITLEEASDVDFELTIKLSEVRVLSYQLQARDSEKSGEVEEDWTFNYETIHFDYLGSRSDGKISLDLTRPAHADNTPRSSRADELRQVARDMEDNELEEAWKRVQEDRRSVTVPTVASKAKPGKP